MAKTNPLSEASMEEMLASIRGIIWSNKPKDSDQTSEAELTSMDDPSTDNISRLFGAKPTEAAAKPPVPVSESGRVSVSVEYDNESLGEVADLISGDADAVQNEEVPGKNEDAGPSRDDEENQALAAGDLPPTLTDRDTELAGSQPDEWLPSPPADTGVADAFGQLASTMLPNNSRTVEQMAEEMMRPMLKDWLDENLPSLVERLVREEIERVSRRR
jgi:uncharacterized protein